MIQLHFFGKGAAFYPLFGNTNSYFEVGEDIFFLDCGEATFEKIVRHIPLQKYNHIFVILTHMHADHAGSLPTFISYCKFVLGKTVHVVYPNEVICDFLRLAGIDPTLYVYSKELAAHENLKIMPIKVEHAKDMDCYGYVLDDGKEAIFYSGDAANINADILERFLQGEIRRIYHDTSSHASTSHCHYEKTCSLVPPEHRKRFYCMHLDTNYEDRLKELGFSVVEPLV